MTTLFDYVCYGANSHNLKKYNYFRGNYDMIRKELSNTQSLLPGTNESVNEVWARLENKLIGLIEKYIPKAMIRKGKPSKSPWMTSQTYNLIRE